MNNKMLLLLLIIIQQNNISEDFSKPNENKTKNPYVITMELFQVS